MMTNDFSVRKHHNNMVLKVYKVSKVQKKKTRDENLHPLFFSKKFFRVDKKVHINKERKFLKIKQKRRAMKWSWKSIKIEASQFLKSSK